MTETLWYVQVYEGKDEKPKENASFSDSISVRLYIFQHKRSGKRGEIVVVVPPHASKEQREDLRRLGVRLM